ncbi:hypothetical protein [Salinimicrobium flavum]|uniref:Uncharacterized protein n=1 Tax=Salinimicrobium flavum TaxID=1737065 RepID=A0ABW5IT09_9FLAO
MIKIQNFTILFLTLLMFSCTSEEQLELETQNDEQEFISIGLDLKKDFLVSQTPLKTEETQKNDLFGIQFYDSSNKPYAFLIGDDASEVLVDLKKSEDYKVKVTYIKDAKDLLYYWSDEGEWGVPLQSWGRSGTILNKVYYTSANELSWISHTSIQTRNLDSDTYAAVDRYYGAQEFTAIDDLQVIPIALKRMIFGLKLKFDLKNINDPSIDSLRFSVNTHDAGREYSIPVVEGLGTLEIPYLTIAVPECESCVIALDLALNEDYKENISISIGTFDNHTRFYDGLIPVQRNKMMVIDHVLEEEETVGGGFGS